MAEPLRYRSGAVARMVGMPVTTLRVWERRYGVGRAHATPSGHRLYSAADVERIALLKRLTQIGHAIGSIAALGMAELRRVGEMHASAQALAEPGPGEPRTVARGRARAAASWPPGAGTGAQAAAAPPRLASPTAARLVVVGAALAQRLQRLSRVDGPWRIVGVFDDLAQAARAGAAGPARAAAAGAKLAAHGPQGTGRGRRGDEARAAGAAPATSGIGGGAGDRAELLLVEEPALPAEVPRALSATLRAWPGARAGLVYGFGADAARAEFAAAGLELVRQPRDDEALRAWVDALARRDGPGGPGQRRSGLQPRGAARRTAGPTAADLAREAAALAFALPVSGPGAGLRPELALPPRRYDDLTLGEIVARAPGMACECPRHVAELLGQLAHFEAYSAQCLNRSNSDAEVHAHLQRVAGLARAMFERALERVALHEGLVLRPVQPTTPEP